MKNTNISMVLFISCTASEQPVWWE